MFRSRSPMILAVAVFGLLLASFGMQTAAGPEGKPAVSLRWALGALEIDGDSPSKIDRDVQLQSGDRLKFLVEPLSSGAIYLLLLDSDDAIHVLYRGVHADVSAEDPGPSYIPPGGQWFKVDDKQGMETFFLLASVEPLADLEALLDSYESADPSAKKELGRQVVSEIRRQHKAHRRFARPIEKPMMIGGQTRGGPAGGSIDRLAVEVSAERFYAKTITIEH